MDLNGIRQIGTIFNSHGIRGELKVESSTSCPEIFDEVQEVQLIRGESRLSCTVLRCRPVRDHWLMQLKEVTDLETAKSLKGYGIFAEEALLKPLDDDEFFVDDLVGCQVFSLEGEYFGIIREYLDNGEHIIYEAQQEEQRFLFPATGEVLQQINLEEKRVTIQLLPDLRELNRSSRRSP